MLFPVATLTLLSLTNALSVKFKDCGSVKGKINSIDISPCTKEPCGLIRGQNSTVTVSYAPSEASSSLKAVVHGIIGGLPVPFPLPNGNGCTSGSACPLVNGQTYTYKATLPVYKIYPTIKVVVKWELQDAGGSDIFCFAVPVEIRDS